MDCAIWKFTCSAISSFGWLLLIIITAWFFSCFSENVLENSMQLLFNRCEFNFFIHILVGIFFFHYWTRQHDIAYFYVLNFFWVCLTWLILFYSLDLYCRELVGFEEIRLLATSIISISTSNWNYCKNACTIGRLLPNNFHDNRSMVCFAWISFLWKIQTYFACEYYIWKCFLRGSTFHFFSWLDFSFLHLGDQAVLRWLCWNYCEYHLAIRVRLSVHLTTHLIGIN